MRVFPAKKKRTDLRPRSISNRIQSASWEMRIDVGVIANERRSKTSHSCDQGDCDDQYDQAVLNQILPPLLQDEASQSGTNLPKCRPHRGCLPLSRLRPGRLPGKAHPKQLLCETPAQRTEAGGGGSRCRDSAIAESSRSGLQFPVDCCEDAGDRGLHRFQTGNRGEGNQRNDQGILDQILPPLLQEKALQSGTNSSKYGRHCGVSHRVGPYLIVCGRGHTQSDRSAQCISPATDRSWWRMRFVIPQRCFRRNRPIGLRVCRQSL